MMCVYGKLLSGRVPSDTADRWGAIRQARTIGGSTRAEARPGEVSIL